MPFFVIPTKVGIQKALKTTDSRFHGNDLKTIQGEIQRSQYAMLPGFGIFTQFLELAMQKKAASISSCGLLLLFFLCLPVNVHSVNVSFIRQIGSERGAGNGQFYEPTGVAVAPDKRLYVVDSVNNRIQIFSRDGEFIKSFGTKGKGDGQFSIPFGIAAGADGRVFVTDSKNSRVQVFDTDGGFLYSFGRGGGRDGELSYPLGIAVDEQERIFIADSGNGRIAVFTMDGLFLDNIGSKGRSPGQLYNPTGVALSIDGKIWVTDTGNNRVLVFDTHGKHLASIGSEGRERNNFSRPSGLAFGPGRGRHQRDRERDLGPAHQVLQGGHASRWSPYH